MLPLRMSTRSATILCHRKVPKDAAAPRSPNPTPADGVFAMTWAGIVLPRFRLADPFHQRPTCRARRAWRLREPVAHGAGR